MAAPVDADIYQTIKFCVCHSHASDCGGFLKAGKNSSGIIGTELRTQLFWLIYSHHSQPFLKLSWNPEQNLCKRPIVWTS